MTQNTQTTAERILDYLQYTVMWDNNHGDMEGYDKASQTIAAEIDALTAERDEARVEAANKQETIDMLLEDEHDAFRHEREQLKAEVERLRPAAEAWEKHVAYLAEFVSSRERTL